MALPSSGPLSMNDIAGEFGGSTPHALNEYYAGGGLVPAGTSGTYGAVPSSGTISIRNFYGTSAVILPGVPSSLVYQTTSPTTLAAVIGNPSTGSPFTQYRITTTPTTSTTTSSTPVVCITGLSALTAYTITGSVSNSGGYGPGLTSPSFTMADSSWTTTGWGLFGSSSTFTSGAGPYITPGGNRSCTGYTTANTIGSFYISSGQQGFTVPGNDNVWLAVTNTSGVITYAKTISGPSYHPSLGVNGASNTFYAVVLNYTSSTFEIPALVGFSSSSGAVSYQTTYYELGDPTRSLSTRGLGKRNVGAIPCVTMGGRYIWANGYPGWAGGGHLEVTIDGGTPVNQGGFLEPSGSLGVEAFTSNNSHTVCVGYDATAGLPLLGSLTYQNFGGTSVTSYSWNGPSYNWMYFFNCVKDESDPTYYTYIVSTIASNSSGGGLRRYGVTRMQWPGSQVWTQTLTSGTGNGLYSTKGLASDSSGNVYAAGYNSDTSQAFIVKYNSSGVIQWQRQFVLISGAGNQGLVYIQGIAVEGTSYLSLEMQNSGAQPVQTSYCRIPTDGTKTGTYYIGSTPVLYQASSYTDVSETITSTSAPSYSVSGNLSLSPVTSSFTIADATLTVQAVTI